MTEALFVPFTCVLFLLCLLFLWGWWRSSGRIRRNNRYRQQIAQRGEQVAERVLRRHGYKILDRQVTGRWSIRVDGQEVPVHSRADLIVQKGRHTYIAEVKTGTGAPDPSKPATRRQLLEYLHVFPVRGVLLVDMVAKRVHEVNFGFETRR